MNYLLAGVLASALFTTIRSETVQFTECHHPDFHDKMQAEWRASSLYPHRSELEYHIEHDFHDHLMHATDLKFEIHVDGNREAAISEIIPICSQSNHERAHCIRQITEEKKLRGIVQLNLPFTPFLGTSAVHVLEPSDDGYDTIYELCSGA